MTETNGSDPPMIDYMPWVRAWEAAMAEAGYPNARLVVERPLLHVGAGMFEADEPKYGWTPDVNRLMNLVVDREWDEVAWTHAHMAFVLVDSLRPRSMAPSVALAEMLEGRWG